MKNRELDWPELLKHLAQFASSERAKTICLGTAAMATATQAANASRDVILGQQALSEREKPELKILDEVTPLFDRLLHQAVLDVNELIDLRQFLNTATFLRALLKHTNNSWVQGQVAKLIEFRSQLSAINHVVSPNGEINEDASPTLQSLCDERRRLAREVSRLMDQIIQRRQLENVLQDKYVTNRDGRMVIPVKSGNQHDLKGLIHDSSQTKQTVFMEPEEVVPLNNRLREVQILIQDEIARILRELSDYLARFEKDFRAADRACLECDVNFAKAQFNTKLEGNALEFSDDGSFLLSDLRHPLLVLQGTKVVPNSVTLNPDRRILLLSGPNAGGKTILLKTMGIAAQMARSGLPVAAGERSKIPFFNELDAIIGDLQSVDENLSSFSSHIRRLTHALELKGSDNLILVDEICGATDPEEGAALARSFIEKFCENNVYAVITSHLGPLKENWPKELCVEHGSLEFDSKTNRPTFQLLLGFPGRSLALSVAQRLGVPEEILAKARSYLSPESQRRTDELEDIERFKQTILEMKEQTQKDREEAGRAKQMYLELVRKFREQRDKWLERALEKADRKIENLIEQARQDRLKNITLRDLKAELPEIVKARPSHQKAQTLDEFRDQFKPGTPAFSSRLGRQVLIQSEPDAKGQVYVLADSMRVQLPWHSLSAMAGQEPAAATQTARRRSSAASDQEVGDYPAELDLRGKRADDALTLLEKWLDDRIREQRDSVKIIHGFGTEQLKKSVRQFLSKSRYVSKWKAGDTSSGGDGVTWVTLAD